MKLPLLFGLFCWIFCAAAAQPGRAQTVRPSCVDATNLQAWLPLEENAEDISGMNHGGTNNGGVWQFTNTTRPHSLLLKGGSNVYVPFACQPAAFTVAFWVRPTQLTNYNCLVAARLASWPGHPWGGFAFHTTTDGTVGVGIGLGCNTERICTGRGVITRDEWQHIVFAYDHGTGSFYRNGVLVASLAGMPPPQPWQGLMIGAGGLDNNLDFGGNVADLRLYFRALSAPEAGALAQCPAPPTTPLACNAPTVRASPDATLSIGQAATLQARAEQAALRFDGVADQVRVPGLLSNVVNTFTVEAWVNPTAPHEIDQQQTGGVEGVYRQRYLIFPVHGSAWGDGHAGMGVSVGTNGVSVYEHAGGYMPPLLVWQGAVTGWTHLAVVYQQGRPSLYINGQWVAQGEQSVKAYVHPSLGFGGGVYGYFQGQADEIRIWNEARTAAQIQAQYQSATTAPSGSLLGYWHLDEGAGPATADASGGQLAGALARGNVLDANRNVVAPPPGPGPQWQVPSAAPLSPPALVYAWSPAAGLDRTDGPVVRARPLATTTYTVTATDAAGCAPSQATVTVTVPVLAALPPDNPADNREKNWTLERSFDGNGKVVAESKQFTDALGRPTQAQARNAATRQVFAAQTVYSTGGQPVLQTLAAPINNQSFNYQENFVTAGGRPYGPTNFEGAKAGQPDAVDAGPIGTLGHYFSQLNETEPLTPTTGYPYSLTEPYEGPLGGTKRAAGPGDAFRMGRGREGKGRDFLLRKEFDQYVQLRPQFVPGSPPVTLEYQGIKSVSVDADGRESIVVTNKEGQELVSCLSGPQYPAASVYGFLSTDPANAFDPNAPPYQDVHIPAAGPQVVTFTNSGTVRVLNLLTDESRDYAITPPGPSPGIAVTLAPGFYRFTSLGGTQWFRYDAHYGNFRYTYYDDAGRVVATVAPNGVEALATAAPPAADSPAGYWPLHEGSGTTAADGSGNNLTGALQNTPVWSSNGPPPGSGSLQFDGRGSYVSVGDPAVLRMSATMSMEAWIYPTGNANGIILNKENEYEMARFPDGSIQWAFQNTSPGWYWVNTGIIAPLNQWSRIGIAYRNGEVRAYLNGNQVGGAYAGAGPIAYQGSAFWIGGRSAYRQFFQGDIAEVRVWNTVHAFSPNEGTPPSSGVRFATRHTYDTSGRLLATESTDEGRTEYVYARDGRIRFSQSALQRPAGRFSYSNYDEVGRVVESGEYTPLSSVTQATVCGLQREGQELVLTAPAGETFTGIQSATYGSGNGPSCESIRFEPGCAADVTARVRAALAAQLAVSGGATTLRLKVDNSLLGDPCGGTAKALQIVATRTGSAPPPAAPAPAPTPAPLPPPGQRIICRLQPEGQRYLVLTAPAGSVFKSIQSATYGLGSGSDCAAFTFQCSNDITAQVQALVASQLSNNPTELQIPANNADLGGDPGCGPYAKVLRVVAVYDAGVPVSNSTVFENHLTTVPSTASTLQPDLLESRSRTGSLNTARCAQRNQIWYDLPWDGTADPQRKDAQLNGRTQEFVLGAVAKTQNDQATTWYSYDELGRVTWVVQQLPGVGVKTLDYTYDFSGNVLEVAYQKDQPDGFHHYYAYDDAQRLVAVSTSPDGTARTLQARYSYYLHGPLKRVELANGLQGVDYTYTLQGWLKGINDVNQSLDPGQDTPTDKDGKPKVGGMPKDLFGLTLDYFSGDYLSRARPVATAPAIAGTQAVPTRYDGTIRLAAWRTAADRNAHHQVAYEYDEKSQLTQSTFGQLALPGLTDPARFVPDRQGGGALHEGGLRYDPNGNLLALQRTNEVGAVTDNFSYTYKPNTNQLAEVHTGSPTGQKVLDYDYDALGQLTRQTDEQGPRFLTYDVTGKTTGVYADAAHAQPLVLFAYDDRGFRVSKAGYDPATHLLVRTTYYVRDVAGNVLSVYEQAAARGSAVVRTEVPLYGAGRLGALTRLDDGSEDYRYELNDHLGNARVVFHRPTTAHYEAWMETDRASQEEQDFRNVGTTRFTGPVSHSGTKVSLLGMYSGQGQGPSKTLAVQRGDTVTFSAYAWLTAAAKTGTGQPRPNGFTFAPVLISGAGNAPAGENGGSTSPNALIGVGVGAALALGGGTFPGQLNTLDGTTSNVYLRYRVLDENGQEITGAGGAQEADGASLANWQQLQVGLRLQQAGTVELSVEVDGLGPDVFVDDVAVEQTGGMIVQEQHQYAFGAPLPGLSYTVGNKRYRYGYQGQFAENDAETGWENFELRIYNSRVGRWMSYDPEGQFDSPYVGMGNNPISNMDPDGGFSPPGRWMVGGTRYATQAANSFGRSAARAGAALLRAGNRINKANTELNNRIAETWYGKFVKDFADVYGTMSGANSLMNIGYGITTGKDKDGNKIGGAGIAFETLGLIPEEELASLAKPALAKVASSKVGAYLLTTAKNIQRHHILPQQYRSWFAARGISNIDDFTIELTRLYHQKVHNGRIPFAPDRWNDLWRDFITANPNAGPSEIFHYAEELMEQYGIKGSYKKYK